MARESRTNTPGDTMACDRCGRTCPHNPVGLCGSCKATRCPHCLATPPKGKTLRNGCGCTTKKEEK